MRAGWVTARANCSVDDCLNSIIKRVKDDVAEFNRLPAHKRGSHEFRAAFADGELVVRRIELVKDYRGTHEVDAADGKDVVVVRRSDEAITACRSGKLHLMIVPQWNPERQECDLQIDEATYPLWQISERILGEFLFDR